MANDEKRGDAQKDTPAPKALAEAKAEAAPKVARMTVEAWAAAKATPDWLFGAARAGNRWALGQELTEQAYDAAIDSAANTEMR